MFDTITRSYSYKLALKSAFVILMGAVVTAPIIYFSLNKKPGFSYAESYNVFSGLRQELFHKSLIIYASTSFFIIVGIVFITLVYSHRVAGPLHRLGIAARRIAAGDLTENVKLRQNDVVHPLADDLNSLAEAYGDILNVLDLHVTELKKRISALPESQEALSAEVRSSVRMISEKADEIKDALSVIKL
jgi:methyl-accepting chemotaxis protein